MIRKTISEDDPLLEVETDKAAVEIPSPCSGTVTAVHVQNKQLVHVGDVMVTFNTEVVSAEPTTDIPTPRPRHRVRSSPAVRKYARSLGVDIADVSGTGSGGRVTHKDVECAGISEPETTVVESSSP